MQYPKIEWENFRDGSGAKTEITVRTLIGDRYGCDERYNKRHFTVSVGKKNRGKYFHVYINSTPYVETKITDLEKAKKVALEFLAKYMVEEWLFILFCGAEQTSNKSAIL